MAKRKVGSLVGLIVAVLAIGSLFVFIATNRADAPESSKHTDADMEGMDAMDSGQAGSSQPEASAEIQGGEVSMNIQNFAYLQPRLVVKRGTKVTWTNQDSARHDVTPDEGRPDTPKSELLGKGESYSFTFNTVGEFSYHCSPHPYMKAKVTVVE